MEMNLNIVRLIDYDEAREFTFGSNESLNEKLAIGFINPQDFEELYLTPSLKLHVQNENGKVIIKFKQDEGVPKGTIVMPVSIWANQLTKVEDGEIINKNIKVEVEASRDQSTTFQELIEKIKSQ